MFLLTSYSETRYIQIKSILENNERHLGKANSCLGVKMTLKKKKKDIPLTESKTDFLST